MNATVAPAGPHLSDNTVSQDATVIGLVGAAHLISHFSQLLLAPLFPWLKEVFQVSYTELGFLMTLFFLVSCAVQAASGFLVDRFGPRPILFVGLGLIGLAAMGYASSTSYTMLAAFAIVGGIGNGVFHPVDYTFLNRKINPVRLGHAYSVHGITGSLGWALAPAMLVPITLFASWRVALVCAGALAWAVLALVWFKRSKLVLEPTVKQSAPDAVFANQRPEGDLDFLRIPAVWMCFAFFFFYAMVLSVIQAFAPEAARHLHDFPLTLVALCLSVYMVSAAGGMVLGGFLASDPSRCERIVGVGFGMAACIAAIIGFTSVPGAWIPVLFGLMGFASGIAGPSRDLLVKKSTPENATGRVYGVVYAGLDIGQAVAPLIFGRLMDQGNYHGIWVGLVILQGILIASAFRVRRARRTLLVPA
ncbi:MFS transporter [Hydrogenophaga sp. PAMC20947]|uniref:MFS transporter n=1 Tax=Hydrogenophaga sp. PAMC20947 TaxID=2565558 RepID=UPI00109DC940|nr:MFS transporter [Hydrogenophaga sp. PAMC20947]QCB45235.1 MFS transporter [Hydrogenophaga sp. PAMC20947]